MQQNEQGRWDCICVLPVLQDIAHARLEFEVTCFGAIQDLLNKTGEISSQACVC